MDLAATDKFGWTVIHHLVSPLDYGTFDNEEMLYVLAKAGAPLDTENKQGETPLKMALRIGALKIARRLQGLLNLAADKLVCKFQCTVYYVKDVINLVPRGNVCRKSSYSRINAVK